MSIHKNSSTRPLVWVSVAAIAALLGLAAGLGIANTILDSADTDVETSLRTTREELSQAQEELQGLQADLEESKTASQVLVNTLDQAGQRENALRTQLSQAEAQTSSALEELAQKTSELEELRLAQSEAQSGLEKLQELRALSDSMENLRGLLVEARKDLPQSREEAFTYWNRIRSLSSRADPSLVSPVDRVILRIDNYFDWSDRSPTPDDPIDDQLRWLDDYTQSGAIAYEEAAREFAKAALLAVITRIDSVVSYLK